MTLGQLPTRLTDHSASSPQVTQLDGRQATHTHQRSPTNRAQTASPRPAAARPKPRRSSTHRGVRPSPRVAGRARSAQRPYRLRFLGFDREGLACKRLHRQLHGGRRGTPGHASPARAPFAGGGASALAQQRHARQHAPGAPAANSDRHPRCAVHTTQHAHQRAQRADPWSDDEGRGRSGVRWPMGVCPKSNPPSAGWDRKTERTSPPPTPPCGRQHDARFGCE